jgi:hypothetical protein
LSANHEEKRGKEWKRVEKREKGKKRERKGRKEKKKNTIQKTKSVRFNPRLQKYLASPFIKQKVREQAVKRVRKDMILHGKTEDDISEEDLEYRLADAESSVWNEIKQTSLMGVLALIGLSFF